jgi:CBS-domain-containing membrane protein
MEEHQINVLPVVDSSGHLIGVVDQAQLTTSLLREVLAALDAGR